MTSSTSLHSQVDFHNFTNFENNVTLYLESFLLADYFILILIITLGLLLGIFAYRNSHKTQIYLAIVLGLLGFLVIKESEKAYYTSSQGTFIINIILFLGVVFAGYSWFLAQETPTLGIRFETIILMVLAFFGVLLLLDNSETLIIFLGLEMQAFTYYTLVSLGEKNISSAEGALKYFLLGALASGLFILGISLVYGITGKTDLVALADLASETNSLMILGALLIVIGLLFKIGAVPFHLWLPDAYEGAPFYVLLFLVTFPKLALFYVLLNVNSLLEVNTLVLSAIVLSAMVGSIQALEQTKIKRFLAYTIIFNNSFFLAMILVTGKSAFFGFMESLILYTVITITTIMTVLVMRNSANNQNLLSLRDLLGLKKNNFFLSLTLMAVFFSSAGIPPLLGFFQKYIILFHLMEESQVFLAVFLILASILPAFYYIRMPKNIYFLSHSKQLLLLPVEKYNATVIALGTLLTLGVFY